MKKAAGTCFVALPSGQKAPPGKRKPLIDFDRVYQAIARTVEGEHLACVRADFEASGGFVQRSMLERLLVAEHVIADLTLGDPHVAYAVGVRRGAGAGTTLLVCASRHVGSLPFDLRPLRVITYELDDDGTLARAAAGRLAEALAERLGRAHRGEVPEGDPIVQVTRRGPSPEVDHTKADAFLARMRFASDLGQRVADALLLPDSGAAVARLAALEREVLAEEQVVAHLHTGLMGIYLGYREKGAYERMVDLYPRLPPELQSTPVAREQLALARNRLAEAEEKRGDRAAARRHRDLAFAALEGLPEALRSSETYGILGRVYKGWSDAEARAGDAERAQALLGQAIETYEAGFRADPRDYYPGVNAVTLRIRRDTDDDRRDLPQLVPVVRFAVERAPRPDQEMERYFQAATKLELACAERDWPAAEAHLADLLPIQAQGWMRQTTIGNLDLQRRARASEGETVRRLSGLIGALQPA
jgi:hypothetical protein